MPQSLDDLASHQLIHYTPVLGMRSAGFEYVVDGKKISLPMSGAVTVNNIEAYEAACLGGLGLYSRRYPACVIILKMAGCSAACRNTSRRR